MRGGKRCLRKTYSEGGGMEGEDARKTDLGQGRGMCYRGSSAPPVGLLSC